MITRNSHSEVFLGKGVLKICSKFTGERPCQKSDKGNSAVLLNRNDSNKRMNEMLSNCSKFKKLDIKAAKEINSLSRQEDRSINFLKKI